MKINFIKKALLLFALSIAIISCDSYDDQTGDSTQVPTNPTLTIAFDFGNPTLLVENDQELDFTVSLSTSNIVDTKVYVTQIGGDADDHDYSVTGLLTIPAGYTSATGTIVINHDEIIENTETLVLQVADERTANTAYSPATAQISIINITSGDLVIDMDWEANEYTTDNAGEEIDPRDLADLRLLITDMDGTILGGADGGSFETYVFSGENPDGEYLVVADFYAAMDDPTRILNLGLEFNQTGTIEHMSSTYEDALNTAFTCSANYYTMVKLTKSGDSYSFEDVSENNFLSQALVYSEGYDVVDAFSGPDGYASEIVGAIDCEGTSFVGINANWMFDAWGEEIIEEVKVYYTDDGAGNITIASQYCFTTLYSGSEYDYTISGTGTIDLAGNVVLNYVLLQDGFSPSGWMFANGYMDQDYFIAEVSPAE